LLFTWHIQRTARLATRSTFITHADVRVHGTRVRERSGTHSLPTERVSILRSCLNVQRR